jgi:hypothetical protein
MMEPDRNHSPALEPTHCQAICHSIGERLRFDLNRDRSPLPPRLRELVDRLEAVDAGVRFQTSTHSRDEQGSHRNSR